MTLVVQISATCQGRPGIERSIAAVSRCQDHSEELWGQKAFPLPSFAATSCLAVPCRSIVDIVAFHRLVTLVDVSRWEYLFHGGPVNVSLKSFAYPRLTWRASPQRPQESVVNVTHLQRCNCENMLRFGGGKG